MIEKAVSGIESSVFSTGNAKIRLEYLIAPLVALTYPFSLRAFHFFVTASNQRIGVASWLGATFSLLAAFLAPFIALIMARRLSVRPSDSLRALQGRRVAYMAVATPPLFTFIGVLTFMSGNVISDTLVYCLIWLVTIMIILIGGNGPYAALPSHPINSSVRTWHRMIAIGVLAVFLVAHIVNHLFGLAGADAHIAVMKILRHVYRNFMVEPILLGGFLYLVFSGGIMAWRLISTSKEMNGYRVLQAASGVYLLFFIIGHLNAVLILARTFLDIDSNWKFATGAPAGLIHDAWNIRLVPLYSLAIFFALMHPLLGARARMLAHGCRRESADGLFIMSSTLAAIVAIAIILGMCGLRLYYTAG